MVHLGEIEKELNTDPKARRAFLEDPVGFFRVRGVLLSPEQAEDLRRATFGIASETRTGTIGIGQKREWRLVPAVQ